MNGILLEQSSCKPLLGCKIQDNLKWTQQVSTLTLKLVKRLSALAHIQYVCPISVRKAIADGLFNSVLLYCLPLFGGIGTGLIRELQVLQSKAARIVCRAPIRANRKELFDRLNWLTVNQLVTYHTLLAVYKIYGTRISFWVSLLG